MWHEARKHERKLRGMMVDYRRRAERRREFYERIKADPAQFLQIHARRCKIHLDPSVALAAENPSTMMPWQGDSDTMIDRFDVRAHLDYIPVFKSKEDDVEIDNKALTSEERNEISKINYERYRCLVQTDAAGLSEDQVLKQIYLDEQFGAIENKNKEEEKKRLAKDKAAIAYTYADSNPSEPKEDKESEEEGDDDDDDSDMDIDLTVDVDELNEEQEHFMNKCAMMYGVTMGDYIYMMKNDKDEIEQLRLQKMHEEEKAMYSGRKARRERRAFREKKMVGRTISPPSYAQRDSPTYEPFRGKSSSRSRSRSPLNTGQVTFITSFGSISDDDTPGAAASTAHPLIAQGPTLPPHLSVHSDPRSRKRSRSHSSSSASSAEILRRLRRSRSLSISSASASSRSSSRSRSRSQGRSRSNSLSSVEREKLLKDRFRSPSPSDQARRNSSSKSKGSDGPDSKIAVASSREQKQTTSLSNRTQAGIATSATELKDTKSQKLTPAEKLKRRMQVALRKTHKADKKKEIIKKQKMDQERVEREEELRELAIRFRRREREKRHRVSAHSSDNSDSCNSSSHSPSPERPKDSEKHAERLQTEDRKKSRPSEHTSNPDDGSKREKVHVGDREHERCVESRDKDAESKRDQEKNRDREKTSETRREHRSGRERNDRRDYSSERRDRRRGSSERERKSSGGSRLERERETKSRRSRDRRSSDDKGGRTDARRKDRESEKVRSAGEKRSADIEKTSSRDVERRRRSSDERKIHPRRSSKDRENGRR